LEWDEKLWDWLDDAVERTQKFAIEHHLEHCSCCRQRLTALRTLDQRLRESFPSLRLDSSFDHEVLSRLTPG
jgi:hypothetical protein